MGNPQNTLETKKNRFGWVKSFITRDSTKIDPVLPITNHNNGADTTHTPNISSHTSSEHADVLESVKAADNTSTARPQAAPPPNDTQATGEKPTTLAGTADQKPKIPLTKRAKAGTIRFLSHTKGALLHSWINVLLIFVPLGIAVKVAGLSPSIVFAMNAVAVIPLAGLLAHATESVAGRLGDTLGALLNVSFGNAVELIIFIALVKNEIRIVQASLLGSLLANLLLILGMAFAAGGLRYREQIYNSTVTQMSAVMLSLSVMSLLLPTAFHASFASLDDADHKTIQISRGTSVILLLVYILYLLFQLKSHAYLYTSMPQEKIDEESHPGILHDLMDTSSSSSSSDSSTTDSDTTSGSVNTAKKIKRYFKKGRRKSSASSVDTHSLPSHVSSPTVEPAHSYFDPTSRRPSVILPDILSGDEGDNEAGIPVGRDFGNPLSGHTSPSEAKPRRKSRKERHKEKKRSKKAKRIETAEMSEKEPIKAESSKATAEPIPRTVGFVEDISAQTVPATTPKGTPLPPMKHFPRPVLPKLLSQNVFVDPQPKYNDLLPSRSRSQTAGLRRTNSLPDRMNETGRHTPGGTRAWPPRPGLIADPKPKRQVTDPAVDAEEEETPEMSRTAAVMMLLISTGLVAVCAEFLVDAIPGMVENSSISQAFIGLIILPIVGNAAEHVTAVTVAAKNKMDLAIGVAVGSSIQIALFITPVVVILGWCMDKGMSLYFNLFETVSLFVAVFVVNFLVLDGRSNYLEGVLLMAAYIIIAVCAFFYPNEAEQSSLGGADNKNVTQAAVLVGRALTNLAGHF
ncbi:calcium/proton exchanger [Venturia nashicola]|uniref:Calcium/proton exchanger n=1 Tax=Venturia nashicola TaxID=86259 RepID=A0A4Z1PI64_9PEZI|nr:calcium/proton exchanger [Venturia nashicola]TLD37523.1 calcium/proton exchanger [Venturia nashicola]